LWNKKFERDFIYFIDPCGFLVFSPPKSQNLGSPLPITLEALLPGSVDEEAVNQWYFGAL
jgi:hypothetical protein